MLTLEDVIERMLRVNISDEKDVDRAVKALLIRNKGSKNANDVSILNLQPFMESRYQNENEILTTTNGKEE